MFKSKQNKKIDIIMPNYNKASFLAEAVNSVLKQTYKNWKLYIIDDASKDNSKKILNKFLKNKKIQIYFLKKNMGPSYCRNYGIKKSKSSLIAFLDSDDFWKRNKLKEQILFMQKNNLNFTFTDYISFFQKNKKITRIKKTNIIKSINYKEFLQNSSINTSTMILERKITKNIFFKNIKKLEDYVYKCDILRKHKTSAVKLNSPSAYYRITDQSRSSEKFKNIFYLWKINKNINKLSIYENFLSIFMISINSIRKYGLK